MKENQKVKQLSTKLTNKIKNKKNEIRKKEFY